MDTLTSVILVFLTLSQTRTKVFAFNIETRNPIVKTAAVPNTYFGFSVAQHSVAEHSRDTQDYWILVGAPQGKNLQPETNRSGALFKCPVTNNQKDCQQIETDGKRFDTFDYDEAPTLREIIALKRPGGDEIKEDQWLGVTVKSQKPGGKVVVCAHRYIQSQNITLYHYGMGLCYLLSERLQVEEVLEPCKGRPTEKLHQQYGFCQVGTSLAVLSDGYTLMGSPGPYTWRGTIFAKEVVGTYLDQDHTIYRGPLNDNPTPIDKYSYLGMSVTGGHFFDKRVTTYVSGAPRSNFNGQVFFFIKTKSMEEMRIELVINGTQFASSFGYEILAVDIDQDGYDELLVAAPFYYGPSEGGAVYLYKNLTRCKTEPCIPAANFTGKPESRFGFSMSSIGDINKDGYTDVAVGAPYEDGGGALYIYLGNKNGLEFSQVIKHKGLHTVGYSMSGGLDMDQNGYPDLLVGAYESDRVILYKTRPIIDIAITVNGKELKNINATKRGCSMEPNVNKTCFSFETCFKLSQFNQKDDVSIKYEIKELAKIPRVTFADDQTETHISVKASLRSYCTEKLAYLIEGTGDILTPIKFQVNYSIPENRPNSPILNKTSVERFEATFQKDCGRDDVCHSRLVLTAGNLLNKTADGYILDLSTSREFVLDANITNLEEPAYEAKLFVTYPESLSYIALKTDKNKTSSVICTSNNESTQVTCSLGNPLRGHNHSVNLHLRFEVTAQKEPKLDLKIWVNSTSTELSTQTSLEMTVIPQKSISYVIKGESKPQNIFYSGKVKGQSAMRYFTDIGPRVIHSYDVINQGLWTIRNMEVEIQWPYQVFTGRKEGGKWLLYLEESPVIIQDEAVVGECEVEEKMKVVNPLGVVNSGVEEFSENSLNDDGGSGVYRNAKRRRRDVEEVVQSEKLVGADEKERKTVTMDCLKKTALCASIICRLPPLMGNNQIKINITARVWNSTLAEDYTKEDLVVLKSVASVNIPDESVVPNDNVVSRTSIETKAYPGEVRAEGVNIWIIVGAALAGLLLLIALIIILYKCGFFKRHRIKDKTLSANLQKQEEENLIKGQEEKTAKR